MNFPLDQYPFAYGQLQLLNENACLEILFEGDPDKNYEVILNECSKPPVDTQYLELSWYRDIRLREIDGCLDAYKLSSSSCEFLMPLHYSFKAQLFHHAQVTFPAAINISSTTYSQSK